MEFKINTIAQEHVNAGLKALRKLQKAMAKRRFTAEDLRSEAGCVWAGMFLYLDHIIKKIKTNKVVLRTQPADSLYEFNRLYDAFASSPKYAVVEHFLTTIHVNINYGYNKAREIAEREDDSPDSDFVWDSDWSDSDSDSGDDADDESQPSRKRKMDKIETEAETKEASKDEPQDDAPVNGVKKFKSE